MPQVSRPLLIALIAVVGFAGAWMTVLRKHAGGDSGGSGGTSTPAHSAPKAPGMTGLGHAIDRAHGAVADSAASAARTDGAVAQADQPATPAPDTAAPATAAPAAAKPAPAPAPAAVKAKPALRTPTAAPAGTTTVLLFAGGGADDAAARQVVRSIHMRHVKTIVAPLTAVSRYHDLLAGVQVTAAPAIIVIHPNRTAQQIVGLPDRDQVLQAIATRSAS